MKTEAMHKAARRLKALEGAMVSEDQDVRNQQEAALIAKLKAEKAAERKASLRAKRNDSKNNKKKK